MRYLFGVGFATEGLSETPTSRVAWDEKQAWTMATTWVSGLGLKLILSRSIAEDCVPPHLAYS